MRLSPHGLIVHQVSAHLICKAQEYLIKTEGIVPMTRSKIGIFTNQVEDTL